MFKPGDIISYHEMCAQENSSLQRGMNYRLYGNRTVILMSLRTGAPYSDQIAEDGRVLIYEGHDIPKTPNGKDPKSEDQPMRNPSGSLTQNGLFYEAAMAYKNGERDPERVVVYEKIKSGIWAYSGSFNLVDAWRAHDRDRIVFKFKLEINEDSRAPQDSPSILRSFDHDRIIPTRVKLEVWKRDRGVCIKCGSNQTLHFDHIIPYSKGGSSLDAKNIQLLCARHNLEKRDRIE